VDVILAIVNDDAVRIIVQLTLLLAFADVVVAILAAIRAKDFTRDRIAEFLGNHLLAAVLPIVTMAVLASGIAAATESGSVPADIAILTGGFWLAARGGLTAYGLSVTKSLQDNLPTVASGSRTPPPPPEA